MSDTYTAEEFAACYALRGYGRRKEAAQWLADNGMTAAEEPDFERCWRAQNPETIQAHRSRYIAMGADGFNPCDPQHQPNSSGEGYATLMRRAQNSADAADRAAKRRMEAQPDERSEDHLLP